MKYNLSLLHDFLLEITSAEKFKFVCVFILYIFFQYYMVNNLNILKTFWFVDPITNRWLSDVKGRILLADLEAQQNYQRRSQK